MTETQTAPEVVDAVLVDEHAPGPHTVVGAALERRPVAHEVIRPLDVEDVVGSMVQHQELLRRILDVSDWQGQPDAKGSFVKKSGWRKIALAYNLSLGRVSEEVERDDQGMPLRATYTAWAEAPNGRRVEATGHCAYAESRFSGDRGNTTKLENDMRATAETRSKNRAISDLIGMGKVSAEEVDAGTPEVAGHPWGEQADRALGEKAFRALTYLLDAQEAPARTAWDKVLADSSPDESRRFFPKAAARAILHAAVVLREARAGDDAASLQHEEPAVDEPAPTFDPVSQSIADEVFAPEPEAVTGEVVPETIDSAHANDLHDAIVEKGMTTGATKALFGLAGVSVTAPMLKPEGGLLDITSGLTVTEAAEVERALKGMTA